MIGDPILKLVKNLIIRRCKCYESDHELPLAEEMQRLILGPLGLSGTVVPDTQPEIPEPHAHDYYRYEDAGEQKTVDVTRQNPSWISTYGDMISTTQDLHTFILR